MQKKRGLVLVALFFISVIILSSLSLAEETSTNEKVSWWESVINFFFPNQESLQKSPNPIPVNPNKLDPKVFIKVCTPQDLDNVRNNLAGNYIQTCDIDLTGYNFEPIGEIPDPDNPDTYIYFAGIYNGQGYKIIGFSYKNKGPSDLVSALFRMNNGTLKNIIITNSYVENDIALAALLVGVNDGKVLNSSGYGRVIGGEVSGGLVGINGYNGYNLNVQYNTTIDNSYFEGTVTGNEEDVGGLVAVNNGIVSYSASKAEVSVQKGGDAWNGVGGLVGNNLGRVVFSESHGRVEGKVNVGGLVGLNRAVPFDDSGINNSYSTSSVNGTLAVGGLVGRTDGKYCKQNDPYNPCEKAERKIISGSFALGEVMGDNSVGGLIGAVHFVAGFQDGENDQLRAIISDVYSRSQVRGNKEVGGLVGTAGDHFGPLNITVYKINKSYSDSFVSGKNYVGGLIGFREGSGSTEFSYWDNQTSNQSKSAGGEGKTTSQMKQQATYKNWDFQNTWVIKEGRTYPYLRWQPYETDLLLNYHFDTILKDQPLGDETPDNSLYRNNGVIEGSTLIIGKKGKALSFDGKSYVVSADIDLSKEFTIGTWIKLDKLTKDTGQPSQIIATKSVVGKTWGPYALRLNADSKPEFFFYPENKNLNQVIIIGKNPLPLNSWTSVVAKLENNELSIYINGVLDSKISANSKSPYQTDNPLYIGAVAKLDGTQQNFLNGALDDFQIYSRPLSDSEIQALYK